MRPIAPRASILARRLINDSPRLQRLVWPTTDTSLGRRRDGAIVVAAAFRALTGREPSSSEVAELLRRTKRGLDFAGLVQELQSTPAAATQTVDRAPVALRQTLEQELDDDPGDPSPDRLLFLHIMKTAGTSLSELLKEWAGPSRAQVGLPLDDLIVMARPQLGRLRAVAGHFPFEVLKVLPGHFQTVTVVREPVARTISHYHEILRKEAPELSLDEFLHSEVYDVPSGNYQARQLGHSIDLPQAWISYSPMQWYLQAGGRPDQPYPLQALFDSTPMFLSEEELLERASAHLEQIDVVGITDELDALVERLADLFGVPTVAAPRLNTTASSAADELPAHLRRVIERRTSVDRELYEVAAKLSRS